MGIEKINFKRAFRFLPQMLLVGVGIGTANYSIHSDLNWIQWTMLSISTSLIIGYSLVTIGLNRSWLELHLKSRWLRYGTIAILCFLMAGIATEVDQMLRSLVFENRQFKPLSARKMYLFNGIISLVLGISFYQYNFNRSDNVKSGEQQKEPVPLKKNTLQPSDPTEIITSVPVKQGDNILLIPLQDIVYFEAFDNYSFAYTVMGEKKLCDYSLLFLAKRLNDKFSRVHRKYIVNKEHIKLIKPHLNGRYIIQFDKSNIASITSSKSYSTTIRNLIKIN
ncbi:LytR/AlgR family response regulator transcription factor [Sungkyunkwania multivorans]|uniref:LytR/AlgR family response regulator transcription factor n=1 Tax=Sungkyunkwania multivorans TaxID=1173618 RepID=A0ABW3D4S7_9FLAO